MAHRLPTWDNEGTRWLFIFSFFFFFHRVFTWRILLDNNTLKRDLYQDLNDFWKLAIQTTSSNLRQGECYSSESVGDWAKRYNNAVLGRYSVDTHALLCL